MIKSLLLLLFSASILADRPIYTLIIKDHLFYPTELSIPANTKIRLIVQNKDNTPEQFDSFDLNREKVIFPHSKGVIFVGPLVKGDYNFFGEYNPNTAVGKIIVVENHNAN